MRLLIYVLAFFVAATAPTYAATTVFADGVFSETGSVSGSANALGAGDGSIASVGSNSSFFGIPFSNGGELVLSYSSPFTGTDLTLVLGGTGFVSNAFISVGEIIGGVATFSAETAITNPAGGGTQVFDLSSDCAALSATGCSLLRVRTNFQFFASGLSIDGASAVSSAPEPSVWGLMILGFIAIALRTKSRGAIAQRRSQQCRSQQHLTEPSAV
ncbi:MAG: hypothetical protein AAFY84_13840 [Pseudomonadota bacterium]